MTDEEARFRLLLYRACTKQYVDSVADALHAIAMTTPRAGYRRHHINRARALLMRCADVRTEGERSYYVNAASNLLLTSDADVESMTAALTLLA